MKDEERQATARWWGDQDRAAHYAAGGVMWSQLDRVQHRINLKVSGSPDVDWIDHLKAAHLADRAPVDSCLSLCCWLGEVERALARRGLFRHCTAYDLSESALAQARGQAAAEGLEGIDYVVQDVNSMVLPENSLDLVVSHGALHHVSALEHVLDQIHRGLKPGGLLVIMEYVGPNRFACSERQLELATCALRLLPARYRRHVSWQRLGRLGPGARRSSTAWLTLAWLKLRNGTLLQALGRRLHQARLRRRGVPAVKQVVPRIVGSEMALDDPTEAVRSVDIRPLVRDRMELVEYRPYGGTLLMPLLDDIAGNFAPDDPAADELLEMLFGIEDALMDCGEIDSDFAFMVARPRK